MVARRFAAAAASGAVFGLGAEWRKEGCAAIGRRTRRFFALHGACDGTVVAWQPGGSGDGAAEEEEEDEALYHVVMDDGDAEDLNEEELDDALDAANEGGEGPRTVAMEVESILEAAWEALEMAIALYMKEGEQAYASGSASDGRAVRPLGLSEAHERLGDAALQNEQPERALAEYTEAQRVLLEERSAGRLQADDRRLADIEWYLGVTKLQLGKAEEAITHYKQAAATLRLRKASLQRAALDAEIEVLQRDAANGGAEGGGGGESGGGSEEIASIGELLEEIEARTREVQQAMGA